jgi:hypothetical protein
MEFFRIKKDIPFMRHALVLNAISLITFLLAVFFIWHNGLHLSIEFTGGTVMEVSYPQTAPLESIRTKVEKLGYTDTQIQNFGSSRDVMIRLPFSLFLPLDIPAEALLAEFLSRLVVCCSEFSSHAEYDDPVCRCDARDVYGLWIVHKMWW